MELRNVYVLQGLFGEIVSANLTALPYKMQLTTQTSPHATVQVLLSGTLPPSLAVEIALP